jgi:hypothetical protein
VAQAATGAPALGYNARSASLAAGSAEALPPAIIALHVGTAMLDARRLPVPVPGPEPGPGPALRKQPLPQQAQPQPQPQPQSQLVLVPNAKRHARLVCLFEHTCAGIVTDGRKFIVNSRGGEAGEAAVEVYPSLSMDPFETHDLLAAHTGAGAGSDRKAAGVLLFPCAERPPAAAGALSAVLGCQAEKDDVAGWVDTLAAVFPLRARNSALLFTAADWHEV